VGVSAAVVFTGLARFTPIGQHHFPILEGLEHAVRNASGHHCLMASRMPAGLAAGSKD